MKMGAMIADKIPQLRSLSAEEKLRLAGELWNELAEQPEAFPPREAHIQVLRERLEHYRQHPKDIIAWDDLKARILAAR
jgi:putative addiction module component (TIGR02574 family)